MSTERTRVPRLFVILSNLYREVFWRVLRGIVYSYPFSDKMRSRILTVRVGQEKGTGLEFRFGTSPTQLVIETSTNAEGPILQEIGVSHPWRITPKRKRLLAFFNWHPKYELRRGNKYKGRGRGGSYLFSYVDHPPVEAHPWLKRATESALDRAMDAMESYLVDFIDDSLFQGKARK